MALCEEIIRSAFRRSGIAAAGVPLNATRMTVGLEYLQGMYRTFVNGALFGRLTDYYLSSGNYTASEGQRIYKNAPASVITIPPTLTDPNTGATRAPLDAAMIVVVDPATNVPAMWIYNTMLAKWQNVANLVPGDVAPMSMEWDDQLKDLLAVYICDENTLSVTPVLAKKVGLAKIAIASRYGNPRVDGVAEYY